MVTATLDLEIVDEVRLVDRPCECQRPGHHPDHNPRCNQDPKFAVRIRHAAECFDAGVFWLCQDCLDETVAWASSLVGSYCSLCMMSVMEVADLVGPVMPL